MLKDDLVGISYQYSGYNCFYIYDKLKKKSRSFLGPYIGNVHIVDILYGTFARDNCFYYVLDQSKYQSLEEYKKKRYRNHIQNCQKYWIRLLLMKILF